jgi:sigma-B regulation protein RsbU (phosphoserine phosphatase)
MACTECEDGEFITLFLACIDVENMTVNYCSCGHEPAILIRDGQVKEMDKGGIVLGVLRQAEYEIDTWQLRDGDCFLFYTDGLVDAANFDGAVWGKQNLLKTAKKFTAEPAERMVKDILGYRRRFVGLARQIDDTSVVVVKVDTRAM